MTRYAARYYDGKAARAQDVTIEVTGEGIAIRRPPGVFIASWPPGRVILTEKATAGAPVSLGLDGTTARLIVDDPAVAADVLAAMPGAARRVRFSRRTAVRIAAWTGLAAGSIALLAYVIIPLLSVQLAARTPESIEVRIGEATLRQVMDLVAVLPGETSKASFCRAPAGLAALGVMTEKVVADSPRPLRLRVHVIDAGLVNALALPGGIVVLTAGLIDQAGSPEEIAGVLAHEIGHVHHRHPTQAIYRTTAVSLLISAVIGDVTGGVLIGALAEWTLNSAYTRDAEREADRFAVDRLNAAGIDGRALKDFFERIMDEAGGADGSGGALRFLSTHPPTRERIAAIAATATGTGKALSAAQWRALRAACGETTGRPVTAFRSDAAR